MSAIERAQHDLSHGRVWKARDRMVGALVHDQSTEALDLLATIHYRMGDLPAAGALWFVTGRDDGAARASVGAWQQRYADAHAQWYSVPRPIRQHVHTPDLRQLQRAGKQQWKQAQQVASGRQLTRGERVRDALGCCMATAFVLCLLAFLVVGIVTALHWAWS